MRLNSTSVGIIIVLAAASVIGRWFQISPAASSAVAEASPAPIGFSIAGVQPGGSLSGAYTKLSKVALSVSNETRHCGFDMDGYAIFLEKDRHSSDTVVSIECRGEQGGTVEWNGQTVIRLGESLSLLSNFATNVPGVELIKAPQQRPRLVCGALNQVLQVSYILLTDKISSLQLSGAKT